MRNSFLAETFRHLSVVKTGSFLMIVALTGGHANGGVWSSDLAANLSECHQSDCGDVVSVAIEPGQKSFRWRFCPRRNGRTACILVPIASVNCRHSIAQEPDGKTATESLARAAIQIHVDESVKSWESVAGTKIVLMIHGGCGVIPRSDMTAEMEKAHREALESSLLAGFAALQKPGATSLDGVVEAIKVLEDSPLFNAGKGAVFTREGKNELDASLMEGRTKMAGAVASTTTIRNPIVAARFVLQKSGHVLMVGEGADQFAKSMGVELVDPSYFATEFRKQQHLRGLKEIEIQEKQERQQNSGVSSTGDRPRLRTINAGNRTQDVVGTVGAVAVDHNGNLAAGTSTGGLNNKRHGRVGDAPIIGAGNYADNESCAVSSTGDGEFFLRAVAAHEISSLVKYKRLSIGHASRQVMSEIKQEGGDGAVIVLTRQGEGTFAYNTEGMYRGYVSSDGKPHVFIYAK